MPDLPRKATFGGFISVLRASDDSVDPRYLFRWFSSPRIQETLRSFGQQTYLSKSLICVSAAELDRNRLAKDDLLIADPPDTILRLRLMLK